ncbi:putative phosphoglycerate mutase family protein [Phaeomoniella chlamydospora]|uniref:Putative phosphoglycerate mutase family protein n=1 Tax=Phaeomoniella chlamydospora TaxID=158046 RepID=A0A0G2H1A3_PHACM|nr:putative phosphoglycerate mutase family protein [Phaeomoniella chlamydospora]
MERNVYVSPRQRAKRTLELLGLSCHDPYPWQTTSPSESSDASLAPPEQQTHKTDARVEVTEAIREWDYGDYEGITSKEIQERREKEGIKEKWDIWTDGCPGGESPTDVTQRLDALIHEIRLKYHSLILSSSTSSASTSPAPAGDVLVVAHGHILRAFAMRWINEPLTRTSFLMEAGGVGTLSYEHKSLEEPAVLLGGGFVVGEG